MEGSIDLSQAGIGVVADDLTGALDTAGAFASQGLRSRVLTAPADKIEPHYDGDVAIANTHTRNVDAALAIAPVHRAAKELSDAGWSLKVMFSGGRLSEWSASTGSRCFFFISNILVE